MDGIDYAVVRVMYLIRRKFHGGGASRRDQGANGNKQHQRRQEGPHVVLLAAGQKENDNQSRFSDWLNWVKHAPFEQIAANTRQTQPS